MTRLATCLILPVLAMLAVDAPAQGQAAVVLGAPIGLEDASGQALRGLHRALRRARRGRGHARLLFYGASHTAGDQFTGVLRDRLQARYGNGGAGLVVPARAFPDYVHRRVRIQEGGPWRPLRIRGRERPEDIYGLAGFATEADEPAWASVVPRRGGEVARFDVAWLRQPRGGHLVLQIDEEAPRRLSTTGRRAVEHTVLEVPEGRHRLELRAEGDGPVRLLGVVMERRGSGVVVDAAGVPGARARDQLPWDEATHQSELRRRSPDLVAFAYGTNEAGDRASMTRYRRNLSAVIERVQGALPRASCLLIGPAAWPVRHRDGTRTPRARIAAIIATQRETAAALGCAFFDLRAFVGGAEGMAAFVAAGFAHTDYVHLTDLGHQRLGEVLEAALLPADAPSL